MENLTAKAEISVAANAEATWKALTDPALIKQYMFDTNVVTDWKEGSKIVWKGDWKGKSYEDHGQILKIIPNKLLQYSHFSPLTGQADIPENYHKVTINLTPKDNQTIVTLSQDNNSTEEEHRHSEENWRMMLQKMKEMLEG